MGRNKKSKVVPKPVSPEKEKVESLVTYQVFFQQCLTKGLVKPWQEREIQAFFKDLGLTDKEPEDSYKIALAKY